MMELPKKSRMQDLLDTWWIIYRTYAMLLKHITCVLYTLLEGPIRPYIAPHRVMWHDFSHHDCMVAGITNDLSSPHRPVRLLARSQSSTFQISLTRVFPSGFRSSSPPFPWYIRPQHFPQYVFAIIDILSSSHARTSSIFSRWSFWKPAPLTMYCYQCLISTSASR